MRALLMLSFLAMALPSGPAHSQLPRWRVGSAAAAKEYTAEGTGSVTDSSGAAVTMKSTVPAPTGFGSTADVIPADPYKLSRVRLRGEVRARNVSGVGASLWLRVDSPTGMLLLDNGSDQVIRGDSGWVTQEITLPVPRSASRLMAGVLLRGTGEMEVRGLRLEALAAPGDGEPTGMAKTVLDSAITLVRTRSMWRDTVTWSVVIPDVRELARGATKSADVYPAIRVLLTALGDRHSFHSPPRQTTQFRTGGAQNPPAAVRAISGGIGYVAVPAYSGIEAQAAQHYQRAVHDSLLIVMPRASCGWIIDLRGNGGGNMYPMLAGLKPFLGDPVLGAFVGPDKTRANWVAGRSVQPPKALAPLESTYVAVLTGPRTASSGEAVTISFRGRARTRSFGAPTMGLSTANTTLPLPDSSMILLTTAIEADRTGREYGGKVDPDEVVGGANDAAGNDDATVAAARWWLQQESRCNATR